MLCRAVDPGPGEPGFDKLSVEFAWPVDGQVVSPFGRRHSQYAMYIRERLASPACAAGSSTRTQRSQLRPSR